MKTMYRRRRHPIRKCVLVILSTFQVFYFLKLILDYFNLQLFQITDLVLFFGILLGTFCLILTIFQFYSGIMEIVDDIRKEHKLLDEQEERELLEQIENINGTRLN